MPIHSSALNSPAALLAAQSLCSRQAPLAMNIKYNLQNKDKCTAPVSIALAGLQSCLHTLIIVLVVLYNGIKMFCKNIPGAPASSPARSAEERSAEAFCKRPAFLHYKTHHTPAACPQRSQDGKLEGKNNTRPGEGEELRTRFKMLYRRAVSTERSRCVRIYRA